MTFKELRKALRHSPKLIQWVNSNIIEVASLKENGAIEIKNLISGKVYILPRVYENINVEVLQDGYVRLGELLPKEMRTKEVK